VKVFRAALQGCGWSGAEIAVSKVVGCLMNKQLARLWKEVVVA
jgi:hypothetical protein